MSHPSTDNRGDRILIQVQMMKVLIPSAMCCALACAAPPMAVELQQPATVLISGTVTQADASCGGPPPPAGVEGPLNAVRPFPNKTFHVIKGTTHTLDTPILARFTSDSTGRFSVRLAPGTYGVLVDEQAAPPDATKYEARFVKMDDACFTAWWAKPYTTLEVGTSDLNGLQFHFNHRCFIQYDIPCLMYIGPLPVD